MAKNSKSKKDLSAPELLREARALEKLAISRRTSRDSPKPGHYLSDEKASEYYVLKKNINPVIDDYTKAANLVKGAKKEALRKKISSIEKRLEDLTSQHIRQRSWNHPYNIRQRGFSFVAVLTLLVSAFFVSFNLTGSVIGNSDTSVLIGVIFFIGGLVFTFLYFKEKSKKTK